MVQFCVRRVFASVGVSMVGYDAGVGLGLPNTKPAISKAYIRVSRTHHHRDSELYAIRKSILCFCLYGIRRDEDSFRKFTKSARADSASDSETLDVTLAG